MSNPYDQQLISALLKAADRLTAAELARALHWSRTRVRKALTDLELSRQVAHHPDRTWEKIQ